MTETGAVLVHRNAKVAIWTEPLWALFGTAALYYLPLLMKVNGLTNLQIGIVVSANLYVALLFQLLAGPLTNRLGRRRATFVFDITSWVVPMFVWALSGNFWLFLLGYLLNATSKVVNVSFWLLATEQSGERERARIFASIKIIILLAGLIVPVVGLAIETFGAATTLKVLFVLGGIAMLLHNLIRNYWSTETEAGLAAMKTHAEVRFWRDALSSLSLVTRGFRSPWKRGIMATYVITNFALQLTIFQVVFLTERLSAPQVVVGAVPAIAAIASLVAFAVLMPRLEKRFRLSTIASWSSAFAALGWALFAAIQNQTLWLLPIAVLIYASGTFGIETYREALVVNSASHEDRAAFYAGVQTLTTLVCIPSGVVAALLFEDHPWLLFVVVSALYAVAAIFVAKAGIAGRNP